MDFDVVVVGGGLVGASFAVALDQQFQNAGVRPLDVAVVEPFPMPESAENSEYQPSFDARSTAISWGARLIYEQLGLWSDIEKRATPIKHIHVSDRGHFGATRLRAEDMRCEALGYVVENRWLGQLHLAGLRQSENVTFFCPASVKAVQQIVGGSRIIVDRGDTREELTAKLVVLSDGGRSGLRESLGIACDSKEYDQFALIANVATEKFHEYKAWERFTDEGPIAMLPLLDTGEGEHRCALVWTLSTENTREVSQLTDEDFLIRLQARFGFRLGRLLKVGSRFTYPLKLEISKEQVRPGLVVVGNAAHTLHPVAGQGYNLALRGALALSDVIRNAHQSVQTGGGTTSIGELSVLTRFKDWHQGDQFKTTQLSDKLIQVFASKQTNLIVARDLGLLGLDIFGPAKKAFARQAMGLG
ncbi:MAG: 2-octaprenyl-6-methoxyphenyl hydroxylase [Proteobacteria bacterium]|nr:MAG: 2-octaprenyl-6-methoxyphenyl hydroxylase [Pseudomonadota bacterium]PIE40518.1 MAG: 2-octaprenyl-6-methoxyphenyl hydroxylase [Gammaproteobacteria bacterium]